MLARKGKKGTMKMTERESTAKAASSAPPNRQAADETAIVNLKRKKKKGTSVLPERELTSKATNSLAQGRKAAEETASTVVM